MAYATIVLIDYMLRYAQQTVFYSCTKYVYLQLSILMQVSNGAAAAAEADDSDSKEQCSMMVVEDRLLVVPRRILAGSSSMHNGAVKNFKKFCKVTVIIPSSGS